MRRYHYVFLCKPSLDWGHRFRLDRSPDLGNPDRVSGPAVKALRAVVNPILTPVRRIMPPPSRTGGWDFSPLIVIILLQMLRNYLFLGA